MMKEQNAGGATKWVKQTVVMLTTNVMIALCMPFIFVSYVVSFSSYYEA
jgi:hypothetical protein